MTSYDQFVADHVAKHAAAAALSVEAWRRQQKLLLREALRQMPLDDDCQACGNTGRLGRFGEMRCPECS